VHVAEDRNPLHSADAIDRRAPAPDNRLYSRLVRIYERRFWVSTGLGRVWRALTDPDQLAFWHGRAEQFEAVAGGRIRFVDPGYEPVEGVVVEAVPERRLRWRVVADGSVITELLEPAGAGTRVTVTHEGEAPPDYELESAQLGWDESLADLILLLETGVGFSRHMTSRSTIGATTRSTSYGVEVISVTDGTFSDAVGLQPGDVLVQLGEAPLFDRSDLALLMREHAPGQELEATFIRDGRLHRGVGELSPRS
jgi:uncharacterized protein YndB with AHSA1/START domain